MKNVYSQPLSRVPYIGARTIDHFDLKSNAQDHEERGIKSLKKLSGKWSVSIVREIIKKNEYQFSPMLPLKGMNPK